MAGYASEQMQNAFENVGMNTQIAASLEEMNASSIAVYYLKIITSPALGKMKLIDFAKDFATAFLA